MPITINIMTHDEIFFLYKKFIYCQRIHDAAQLEISITQMKFFFREL